MTLLRVLVSALSAKSYGGDSYFRSLLPVLARMHDQVECILVVSNGNYDGLCPADGAVRLLRVRVPALLRGPARVAWEQILLLRLARQHGASVIYAPSNSGLLFHAVPSVMAVRNMWPLSPLAPGTGPLLRLRHIALSRLTRLSARSASRVIAVSEAAREAVLAMGVPVDRIDLIYHGADDLPRPDVWARRRGGFMGASAKFVRYANLETIVRAFARLRRRGYAGELRVAGGPYDGSYERTVRALVAGLGLESAIRFLGYLPRDQVLELMRDCDAFLFPSTLEACPFTLLEAMSQGAAIVATTRPPMPEFTVDAAVLVEPFDDEAFADAAWQAVTDSDWAGTLRQRARARADVFRWADTVRRLIRCWQIAATTPGCLNGERASAALPALPTPSSASEHPRERLADVSDR